MCSGQPFCNIVMISIGVSWQSFLQLIYIKNKNKLHMFICHIILYDLFQDAFSFCLHMPQEDYDVIQHLYLTNISGKILKLHISCSLEDKNVVEHLYLTVFSWIITYFHVSFSLEYQIMTNLNSNSRCLTLHST